VRQGIVQHLGQSHPGSDERQVYEWKVLLHVGIAQPTALRDVIGVLACDAMALHRPIDNGSSLEC
jgi:hypothetical protein